MLLFVLLYWASSIFSRLNIGVRHILPVLPFSYILAIGAWKRLRSSMARVVLALLLAWTLLETLRVRPNFVPYYNQFAGGPAYGYRFATDSNYDWGQDLKRFAAWLREHPEVDRIAFHPAGPVPVERYPGLNKVEPWLPRDGSPAARGVDWFAVSVEKLQISKGYEWLKNLRPPPAGIGEVPPPDYRAGSTIFIYRLADRGVKVAR